MAFADPEVVARETLHEIIRAGLIQPLAPQPIGQKENGKKVGEFIEALYSQLTEMYSKKR